MMIILLLSLLLHICDSISSDMTIEKCQEIGFNSTDLECKVLLLQLLLLSITATNTNAINTITRIVIH